MKLASTETAIALFARVAVACLFAGFYGAVHNQISYTVSPEYFTAFKFLQFGISPLIPHRVGAAIVGWGAAWWMGLVICAVLVPVSLRTQGGVGDFRAMVRAFGLVALTALGVGLVALGAASLILTPGLVGELSRYGNEIGDDVAFARAGMMHNFSYLGGLVGVVVAARSLVRAGRQLRGEESGEPPAPRSRP